jgi:F0F1-type ATP synthase assembly protein I
MAPLEYPSQRPDVTQKGGHPHAWLGLLSVGMVLVACILIGYLAGSYLDREFDSDPWLTVTGVLLGTVSGFVQLFRTVSRYSK